MHLFDKFVVVYFIIIGSLLHSSLLFCSQSHCLYRLSKPPISDELAYYLRVGIINLIPLSFKMVQQIAQWFIIIEAILLLVYVSKKFRLQLNIDFKKIALIICFGYGYYLFIIREQDPQTFKEIIQENYSLISSPIKKLAQFFAIIVGIVIVLYAFKIFQQVVNFVFKLLVVIILIGVGYFLFLQYQDNPEDFKEMVYKSLLLAKDMIVSAWQFLEEKFKEGKDAKN